MKRSYHGQMSESFVVGILLCLCGGFQDAYTYVCRDKVFANAQTGNIVLLGNHLAQQDWSGAVRYAVPILAFTAGIFVAQKVHFHFGKSEKIHWRQLVLLLEIVVLFAAGFFPIGMSLPANALISFSCAMQVDSFRACNSGSDKPTSVNNSIKRRFAALRPKPIFCSKTSVICAPTLINGLSAVCGSWKIIAISLPRMPRQARSLLPSSSAPINCTLPLTLAWSKSPIRAKAVTDLPEPDSPTKASFSPARMCKQTSCTTVLSPKAMLRFWVSSKGCDIGEQVQRNGWLGRLISANHGV